MFASLLTSCFNPISFDLKLYELFEGLVQVSVALL